MRIALVAAATFLVHCGAPSAPPTTAPSPAATVAPVAAPVSSAPDVVAARKQRAPHATNDAAVVAVAAADRTDDDHKKDVRRLPAQLLSFMGVAAGMRVADLGAGDGYTTELLVRMVGAKGKVWAQNNSYMLEKFVGESWPARLKRPINAHVIRVDSELETPLPADASGLDLVTMVFYYHDAVVQQADRAKMNAAIFAALKPGGHYVVVDHSAKPDAGTAVAEELHRLHESVVKKEISAAGFKLVAESDFLRDPDDPLDDKSFKRGFITDRYALKFAKPE